MVTLTFTPPAALDWFAWVDYQLVKILLNKMVKNFATVHLECYCSVVMAGNEMSVGVTSKLSIDPTFDFPMHSTTLMTTVNMRGRFNAKTSSSNHQ